MPWGDVTFTLPLGRPPKIQRIAVGTHEPNDGKRHFGFPGHWYVNLYSYRATVTINGARFPIEPGYVGLIPPESKVSYRFTGRSTHLFAHFLPDADSGEPTEIPAMRDLGDGFLPLADRFYEAIRAFSVQPARAECRLWDVLWEISRPSRESADPRMENAHPAVRRVCQMIEQSLWRRLTVPWLAELVDLSADHLTALFRKQLGTTVVAYVRHRRTLRARHLLLHSSLPLKTIAQQVGIPDPHHFNKTIRRELGHSPSVIRERGVV